MLSFTMMPNNILQSGMLDSFDKNVLFFLASYNPCFPSLDTISKTLLISRPKVQKVLKKLRKLNFLTYEKGNSYKKANLYFVNLGLKQSPNEESNCCDVRKPGYSISGNPVSSKKNNIKILIREETAASQQPTPPAFKEENLTRPECHAGMGVVSGGTPYNTFFIKLLKREEVDASHPPTPPAFKEEKIQRELPLKTLIHGEKEQVMAKANEKGAIEEFKGINNAATQEALKTVSKRVQGNWVDTWRHKGIEWLIDQIIKAVSYHLARADYSNKKTHYGLAITNWLNFSHKFEAQNKAQVNGRPWDRPEPPPSPAHRPFQPDRDTRDRVDEATGQKQLSDILKQLKILDS